MKGMETLAAPGVFFVAVVDLLVVFVVFFSFVVCLHLIEARY